MDQADILGMVAPGNTCADGQPTCYCRTALNVRFVGGLVQFSTTSGLVQVRLLPVIVPEMANVPKQRVLLLDVVL